MFPPAFADVAFAFLKRWAWAFALLALLGFGFMFYRWAYERGETAERERWVNVAVEISDAAYESFTEAQKALAKTDAELAESRDLMAKAFGRNRSEREAHYAQPNAHNGLCFTPPRGVRVEAGLAETAAIAAPAGSGDREMPAGGEAAGEAPRRER